MKDTTKKIAFFTITEYEKEQEWLSKWHRRGWKLTKATPPCFYKFERCEPDKVVYQLDYNKEGLEHKGEYIQMFADCGWEYVDEMLGYSYFRKPKDEMVGDEEIFCDDNSRMDMIERVFKGRMIPLLIILFLIIIPQIIMMSQGQDEVAMFLLGVFIGALIVYVTVFVDFAVKYIELKKRIGG